MKWHASALVTVALAGLLALGPGGALAEGRCVPQAETQEIIAANGLIRPVIALRSASVQFHGEAVGAKLCRWNRDYVYEIAVLQKDGRVIHVFVNAATGANEVLPGLR